MLFVESRELNRVAAEAERPRVLEALAGAGFQPLARAARRRLLELSFGAEASGAASRAAELERRLAPRGDGAGPLHPGDLFCFPDHALYLVFREQSVRAGLVHAGGLDGADARLEEFCRAVAEHLPAPDAHDAAEWSRVARPASLEARAAEGLSLVVASAGAEAGARASAAHALEDERARGLLRRLRDVGAGPAAEALGLARVEGAAVERLVEAGLLRRDVRVTCRHTGHALLDLPASDSLALITASRARCALCAAEVADEMIEERLNPTELAAALLDGAAWLRDRVLSILSGFGVAERAVSAGDVGEHGEACLLTEVCGEPFLFFVRDGDLTPEATRRAVAHAADAGAAHLFAVVTGAVEDGARMRLYEFSWRRARDGRDLGVTILEGLAGAETEIGRALAAAARRKLARELSALDPALGLSAAQLLLARFDHAPSRAPRLEAAQNVALQKWETST
jgi:hypothetical protein